AAGLQVLAVRGGPVRIVVHVADATRVELAGDFTDWEPLALTSTGPGEWEAVIPIVSGVHRINVRIDGTAWIVPAGTTRAPDDYGSGVGIFVVPYRRPPAKAVASGRRRNASIAHTPPAGPKASRPLPHRHPIRSPTHG